MFLLVIVSLYPFKQNNKAQGKVMQNILLGFSSTEFPKSFDLSLLLFPFLRQEVEELELIAKMADGQINYQINLGIIFVYACSQRNLCRIDYIKKI